MEDDPFTEAAEVLRSLVPAELGDLRVRAHRYGLKVWFDTDKPPREHYEAQVIGARHVPGARMLAIEVGFHAEHPKEPDNDRAFAPIAGAEKRWRKALGPEPVAGEFLGRAGWRRLSETWLDPDLGDPDLPHELAARLLDYLDVLEPVRRVGL